MDSKSIYADFILKHAPKVLTQIDRDEHSPTFGSCDRNFWHLKTRDFSSAILQQSGLALALLYATPFEGNMYYRNENVRAWALGTLRFWQKIQLSDGSFNEYYPNEHGFPPTAFTLFSTAEAYKVLAIKDEELVEAMKKTAKWLIGNVETKASNQEMASIAALCSLYSITRDNWIKEGLEAKLRAILKTQSNEGWFPEYGGADFGYLSVCFDMLAEYYRLSNDVTVLKPLEKALDFFQYFCHPDGTIGGEYGSRNTIYFLPGGLEVMINAGSTTAMMLKKHLFEQSGEPNYFQDSIDDRYLSHYVLHSFLRALAREQKMVPGKIDLPCFRVHEKFFPQAGLCTFNNGNYFCVIGLSKGGLIKAYKGDREVFTDYGYRIPREENRVAATNWLDQSYVFTKEANLMAVKGTFNSIKLQTSSPAKHVILRLASYLLGKSIIGSLKNKLIFIDEHDDVEFSRQVLLEENRIIIEDTITSSKPIPRLLSAGSQSLRHVASGKFYMASDLKMTDEIDLENVRETRIEKVMDFATEKEELTIDGEKLVPTPIHA